MTELQHCEDQMEQAKAQLEQERATIERYHQQVEEDRKCLEAEKAAMMKHGVGPNNLVGLNFRGEKTMVMKRSVLCQIEGSMLAAMFSGRYEDNLDFDQDGNVYVGYPPAVMVPLMDWLTGRQDVPADAHFPDVKVPEGMENIWDGAVNFFGLQSVLSPSSPLKMFNGVQANLKLSDLSGWQMVLCKPAHGAMTMTDFSVPGVAQDSVVLIGAKKPNEDELLLAAIGRLDVIATPGKVDCYHNGVYWSLTDHCFAFANTLLADQVEEDYWEEFTGESRLLFCGLLGCTWSKYYSGVGADHFERVIMIPTSKGVRFIV